MKFFTDEAKAAKDRCSGGLDRLAFHLLFLPSAASARKALARLGSIGAVLRASPADLAGLDILPEMIRAVGSGECFERAESEVKRAAARGVAILTIDDDAYPSYLKEIPGPPGVLYCAGRLECLRQPSVAIVGSRRPTPYGRITAEVVARDLAMRGVVIVSGLAIGIDAAAHWGALREENGETVAILGSGLDVIYPGENRGLAAKIMERGAVVTEYPFGTRPERRNFPVRNRIISGLSLGVVVIEAAARSGSLLTAGFALDQNREVMAVPGNITSEMSRGTNRLLKEGARLVERWEDAAGALPEPWAARILAEKPRNVDNRRALLTDEEKNLLELIPPDGVVEADELLERTERSVPELLALLLELELKGVVLQHPGRQFQRRL